MQGPRNKALANFMCLANVDEQWWVTCFCGLKQLLELPVTLENVTLKRPSLNDTFLQLTGRDLRE